mmetsp:Transcript_29596/g.90796  ORF Transcript_29596/g.90796 Transcript_29596/m.90796 type:complete len:461 (+) Transcript_29596:8-1390(+)
MSLPLLLRRAALGVLCLAVAISLFARGVGPPEAHFGSLHSTDTSHDELRFQPGEKQTEPFHGTEPHGRHTLHASEQREEPSEISRPERVGCTDLNPSCSAWAMAGECVANPDYMGANCNSSCGACDSEVLGGANPKPVPTVQCKDESDMCSSWATAGECEANSNYMSRSCARSCNTCEQMNAACARPNSTAAVRTGEISSMFEYALEAFHQYRPRALSRDPWVLAFDDFISETEAQRLIELCADSFTRSMAGDQLSPVRTSHQCWGSSPTFLNDPTVKEITRRVGEITRTPVENSEYFQVVRYEEGQFYKIHHDQNSAPFTPQGERLYTFFIYLSTPGEGGGTHFNDLGFTMEAKRGSAVLWPSLLDEDVSLPDLRTHHEALPVERGLKYGANLWIHQYDFRTPSSNRCEYTVKNSYNPEAQLERYLRARKAAGKAIEVPTSMRVYPGADEALAKVLAES